MKRSTERILTTHCGSLARPQDLIEIMRVKENGQPYDHVGFARRVRSAVADVVSKQVENGVDIVCDGEQSKAGFAVYVRERLTGFEPRPTQPAESPLRRWRDVQAFPEYYEEYFKQNMRGIAPSHALVCVGPVTYKGQAAVQTDIENLKAALQGMQPAEVFMPAIAPRSLGQHEYYPTEEAYIYAIADAMHEEYKAIVDAGFILQVDDPALTNLYGQDHSLSFVERHRRAELYIEALNHALRDIPPEQVRFHTCYGINEGPRIYDTPLKDIVDLILQVHAGAYSFEAANPRHAHEWHVWEQVKLPDGKVLIPGMISHASNIVEHPEFIAGQLLHYARLVGRENVIAGSDCGFSSQATLTPEVHPTVVWAKFQAMAEGARLATQQLWGRSSVQGEQQERF
jgi:5-methyltetrahydropteroyltriglutamate--homocysteine methyltransferase